MGVALAPEPEDSNGLASQPTEVGICVVVHGCHLISLPFQWTLGKPGVFRGPKCARWRLAVGPTG